MIIFEAVLTFLVALIALVTSLALVSKGLKDEIEAAVFFGLLAAVVCVLTAVFQGVALGGYLVVTEAIFTFITAGTLACCYLLALIGDRNGGNGGNIGWVMVAGLAVLCCVIQGVVLAS